MHTSSIRLNKTHSTSFPKRKHRNTSSTTTNPSISNPLIISSYTHIPSTKQITTSHRSISESTALSSTKYPIKLKRTFKHLKKSSSYLFNEDSLKTKRFIPSNAISVSERKLIRKISLRISSNEAKPSKAKHPYTSNKSSSSKPSHLLFATIRSSSQQQLNNNNNITKSLHIIHSINTLQQNINNYTKEFAKHKTPHIPGLVRSHSGSIIKPNHSCTLYIKKRPEQANLIQRLISSDNNNNNNTSNNEYMSLKFKLAIKWEGIYQLWRNHSIILETLINKYCEYKWFLDKNEYITDQTLKEFMRILRIESSSVFFKDVFDLFGFDNNICKYYYYNNHKESKIINVKMFFQCIVSSAMNGVLETKVEMLCHIWEHIHMKVIYVKDVLYLLKECLFYAKDYDMLKKIFTKQFHCGSGSSSKDNYVMKKEFYNYIISHDTLRLIFQRNLFVDYNKVHQIFKEEVLTAVNSTEQNWKTYLSEHNMKEYNIGVINRLERVLSSILQSQQERKGMLLHNISENEM